MPLTDIASSKDSQQSHQPLLLATITFPDGTIFRASTHPLSSAEGGYPYGGNNYAGRIISQDIGAVQGYDTTGIDLIPRASLTFADADKALKVNYEDVYGFAGATLDLTFVLWDADTADFSSDSIQRYLGICDAATCDHDTLTVTSANKLNLQRRNLPSVPIQRRCPWIFPTTVEQRQAGADDEDSVYFSCGYSPDASGGNARGNFETGSTPFASCAYTKADCVARGMYSQDSSSRVTGRFGGVQWDVPVSSLSREYTSGNWIGIQNSPNEAKYGQPVPMVYGTAWVDAVVTNVVGDGNSTRGEAIVCLGEVQNILRVVVNDFDVPAATDITGGTNYRVNDALLRYNVINRGDRNGAPNLDAPYSGNGDPYGSMCAVLWVVPRRAAESSSVPRLRVLVQGPKLRTYSDTSTFTSEYTDNPAWVLMDLLIWAGLSYSDLDIQTFIDSAAICAATIPYVDQYGNTSSHARYSCSLVLRQRRSASDVIRAVRQGCGGILVPNSTSGKLQLYIEGTLASQQPSAVAGSNYGTAISSKLLDGTTANGYVAYDFTKFLGGKQNSLKVQTQPVAAAPNRVQFQFVNSERDWALDSLSMADSDAIARAQQEVNEQYEADGINTFDQAKRIARRRLARNLRANGRGDAGGTEIFSWLDSFRTVRCRVGQIVRLSCEHYGISNVLARLIQLRPSTNFETVQIVAVRHDDAHYLDMYGQEDDPETGGNLRNRLDRPSYPWGPAASAPDVDDPMFEGSDITFEMYDEYAIAADERGVAYLNIRGRWPVNMFSTVRPPIVGRQGTTASTGGTIPGTAAYYYCLCAVDSEGKFSPHSRVCKIDVTSGTDTNTLTIPVLEWPVGMSAWKLFGGTSPHLMTLQAGGSSTGASITVDSYSVRDIGVPDPEFDRMRIKVKRVFHSGNFGQEIDDLATNGITIGGAGWTADEWVGRTVSVIGKDRTGPLEVWNFLVTANTDEVLTVTPDPVALGVEILDVLVMRSVPTVGSDGDGNYLEDLKWENSLDGGGGGLRAGEEVGRLLRFIAGPAAGEVYKIKSNTATRIYIQGDWRTTPDSTSRYIVEEPDWQIIQTTDSLNNDRFREWLNLQVEVTNYLRQVLLVQAYTVDGGGNESMDALSPWREIYLFGEPGDGPYEQANFALGMCDPLEVAEDLTNRALVLTPGTCFRVAVNAKVASVGARAVLDLVKLNEDGVEIGSLFPDGNDNKIVIPADQTGHFFFTLFSPLTCELAAGEMIRPDVLETGTGCAKVSVKLMWRRLGGKPGTLSMDFETSPLAFATTL